jgi:nucleoside-diphosphate-sugar epimerase
VKENMVNKNILITGATGAVGNEVLRQLTAVHEHSTITVFVRNSKKTKKLLKPFPQVKKIYGDITNFAELEKACINQDYVIHLAAVIPPLADEKPEMTYQVNVEGTRNIVEALEKHSPNALLLYSSSVAVYGDRLKTPNIVTTDDLKLSVGDSYGITKIESEKIIQESTLNWSIFRLSAIMGIGNHKISKLMFHMPLETVMEIATVRDTARAFVNSIGQDARLAKRIFNLGGGELCRISYLDFMTRAFDYYGMGAVDFPKYAFAKINFHCGNYVDGHELEEIVHFRQDTIDIYFERFGAAVPGIQRFFTKLVNKIVKKQLLRVSEPYLAHKTQNKKLLDRFFGDQYPN